MILLCLWAYLLYGIGEPYKMGLESAFVQCLFMANMEWAVECRKPDGMFGSLEAWKKC